MPPWPRCGSCRVSDWCHPRRVSWSLSPWWGHGHTATCCHQGGCPPAHGSLQGSPWSLHWGNVGVMPQRHSVPMQHPQGPGTAPALPQPSDTGADCAAGPPPALGSSPAPSAPLSHCPQWTCSCSSTLRSPFGGSVVSPGLSLLQRGSGPHSSRQLAPQPPMCHGKPPVGNSTVSLGW